MSKFYPKPYKAFGKGIKVKVNLSNYATKTDLNELENKIPDISNLANKNCINYCRKRNT